MGVRAGGTLPLPCWMLRGSPFARPHAGAVTASRPEDLTLTTADSPRVTSVAADEPGGESPCRSPVREARGPDGTVRGPEPWAVPVRWRRTCLTSIGRPRLLPRLPTFPESLAQPGGRCRCRVIGGVRRISRCREPVARPGCVRRVRKKDAQFLGLVRRRVRVLTGPVDPLAVHTDPRVGGSRIADAVNLAIMTALP